MATRPLPAAESREIELAELQRLKMARSAHAYVRGNTRLFYKWLADSSVATWVPSGPDVWICGDCHVGNLGPLIAPDGAIDIQIRDLDQTVIGNPAHDLIRLGLSLATAARSSDLPGVATARIVEAMVEGYERSLSAGDVDALGPEPDAVRYVKRRAFGRRWRHLAREWIGGDRPRLPLGPKFWPLSDAERASLDAIFADPTVKRRILPLAPHTAADARLLDAAYWRKGCSSLGLLRFAALVEFIGEDGDRATALVDVKAATEPLAPVTRPEAMPRDPAERVAAGTRALSPNLGARVATAHVLGRPVFIRQLAPQDLKLELEQFSSRDAVRSARHLAYVVGQAHARQMHDLERAAWRRALAERRGGGLDAPSWLWRAVVELAARHEGAYLEHCRRHALAA